MWSRNILLGIKITHSHRRLRIIPSFIIRSASHAFGTVMFHFNGGGIFAVYAPSGTAYIGAICGVVVSLFLAGVALVYFVKNKSTILGDNLHLRSDHVDRKS